MSVVDSVPYGPERLPWRETISEIALSKDGEFLVSPPSADPLSLYLAVPGTTSHLYQVPSSGLTPEQQESAFREALAHLSAENDLLLSSQGDPDIDCNPIEEYITERMLRRELGDRFEHFQSLDSFEKSSYVLGSEVWEEYSSGLFGLIKDFVLSVWEERKVRLYGEHANVHQSHSQNDSGDLRGVAGGDGELGCLCGNSHLCDGSAHSSGCVVNGSNAMAAV